MPSVEGTVDQIFLEPQYCCVTVRTSANQTTFVVLWSYITQEDNAANRLVHGAYLGLVRDAFNNGSTVSLFTDSGSGLVTSVTLKH